MLPIPPLYYAVAAGIAAAGVIGFMAGRESALDKYHDLRVEVAGATAKHQAEQDAKKAANEQHSREVAHGYAQAIDSITRDYNSRLSRVQPRADCPRVPAPGPTPAVLDGPTTDPRSDPRQVPSEYEVTCTKLEQDCAKTTTQLLWLQQWIRGLK